MKIEAKVAKLLGTKVKIIVIYWLVAAGEKNEPN